MITEIRTTTGKLAFALALWASAFVSVARAQTPSNLEELAVAGDQQAPALASPNQDTDRISSKIERDSMPELTWTATAANPLATCTGAATAGSDSPAEPLLMAHAGEGPLSGLAQNIVVFPPRNCFSLAEQSFFPLRFQKAENGAFITEFDASAGTTLGGLIGLSPQPTGDYTQMPVIISFGFHGNIIALNGDLMDYTTFVPYTPGVQYHFWVYVNVQSRLYSVLVTPPGGSQQVVAFAFHFGNSQNPITSLDYWDLRTFGLQTIKACNFKLE